MPIEIQCVCGRRLRAREEYAGRAARCGACGQIVQVPALASPPGQALTPSEQPAPHPTAEGIRTPPVASPVLPDPGTYRLTGDSDSQAMAAALVSWTPHASAAPHKKKLLQLPPPPPKGKRLVARRASSDTRPRDYLYWVLAVSLLPLIVSLVHPHDHTSLGERIRRTLKKGSPHVAHRPSHSPQAGPATGGPSDAGGRQAEAASGEDESADEPMREAPQSDDDDDPNSGIVFGISEQVFDTLPNNRIEGALLPRRTTVHWLFAAVSAALFLGVILMIFPGGVTHPFYLVLVGVFTATIGICFLLVVQFLAIIAHAINIWPVGRSFQTLLFYLLKFIGFSYRSALDPHSGFFQSFFGFTLGVGLCEELCKGAPLLIYFRRRESDDWRGACLWGMATGVGFGVSEGISYASNFYNGIEGSEVYLVRFLSCVALHAVWSAGLGISMMLNKDRILDSEDAGRFLVNVLRIITVPMVLHGLYDTLLKQEIQSLALVVALASFGWLAWLIETVRREEEAPAAMVDE